MLKFSSPRHSPAESRRERPGAAASRPRRRDEARFSLERPHFRAALQADGALELQAYDVIGRDFWSEDGGITAKTVKQQIDSAGAFSKIRLRINSPGGDAFEGAAIYNLLRAQGKPIECYVDGIAASAASLIAMCGDTITMGAGAMLMIHNAWSMCVGDTAAMAKESEILAQIGKSMAEIYQARSGIEVSKIVAMMAAETWLGAQEAVDQGFATAIAERSPEEAERGLAFVRSFSAIRRFRNAPMNLRRAEPETECECDCAACEDGNCAECSNPDCDDPNCVDCPEQNRKQRSSAGELASVFRAPQVRFNDLTLGSSTILAMRKAGTAKYALAGNTRKVCGVAAPYNSLSADLGGFREVYQPGCFKESVEDGDDVRVLFNHDVSLILGRRSAGTARIWEEADGLHYEADLPDTQIGRDLAVMLGRGDVRETSAAFYILQHRWEMRNDERVRVIEKAKLVEVSPHAFAAYSASVARAVDSDVDYSAALSNPRLSAEERQLILRTFAHRSNAGAQPPALDPAAKDREILARQERLRNAGAQPPAPAAEDREILVRQERLRKA
ncbi:MAG TPA: head maturation protease, ClpP-related [Bryobacteraceae bacterium]|nr:head maturation protease, ClpP-related [Bryobacteraceae bacterium]